MIDVYFLNRLIEPCNTVKYFVAEQSRRWFLKCKGEFDSKLGKSQKIHTNGQASTHCLEMSTQNS